MSSLILRSTVRSWVSSSMRVSCWVIVEAPWVEAPALVKFEAAARAMPNTSKPG